ncbi:hypothetical protein KQX54_014567 [Cotesia glomerata]|uniref:Uncharacterized protein n=1 Tax=Cotesia glomerata TaxID=32391 RepID=A0AAV7I2X8_COTGL|nr:hypothetical protein KQX54_014567 [Cotesia glomerata]
MDTVQSNDFLYCNVPNDVEDKSFRAFKWIEIKNIKYTRKMVVLVGYENLMPVFAEIKAIVTVNDIVNSVYFICNQLLVLGYYEHVLGYEVNRSNSIIWVHIENLHDVFPLYVKQSTSVKISRFEAPQKSGNLSIKKDNDEKIEQSIESRARKFENAKSFNTSWPDLPATFEDFILSKKTDDVDAAAQVVKLAELVDDDKDTVIISLLLPAIKSSISSTVKRRKVENHSVVDGKTTEFKNSYIITVEKSDELKAKIKARRQTFITNEESFYPFRVFVGPVCKPVDFYGIIDNTKLNVDTALEALDVAFKIFLITSCPFAKFVSPTYF